jgi:hypothetical protein
VLKCLKHKAICFPLHSAVVGWSSHSPHYKCLWLIAVRVMGVADGGWGSDGWAMLIVVDAGHGGVARDSGRLMAGS